MNSLFSFTKKKSEKNGSILAYRLFGKTSIFVHGFDQSTDYIVFMWREALGHLPKTFSAKSVLMLGLGGGSAIKEIRHCFPGCKITVVEWDPVMIDLYHNIHKEEDPISIIQGDASVVVPAMTEKFDLVLVDLFTGNVTPKELRSASMVSAISHVTHLNGFCILNAFVSLDLLPVFDQHFSRKDTWEYKFNTLVLYKPNF
ncbi:MAG: methyltransferase domain-containing protein [Patescibacteria group bacterium]|jgi:spermidine synthase